MVWFGDNFSIKRPLPKLFRLLNCSKFRNVPSHSQYVFVTSKAVVLNLTLIRDTCSLLLKSLIATLATNNRKICLTFRKKSIFISIFRVPWLRTLFYLRYVQVNKKKPAYWCHLGLHGKLDSWGINYIFLMLASLLPIFFI
jgi:hypothetical protein